MRRNAVAIVGSAGRTCAGGLTKFEPKELERIPIPKLGRLCGRKNGERLRPRLRSYSSLSAVRVAWPERR